MTSLDDDYEEPIYHLASDCERLFDKGVSFFKLRASEAIIHLFQEYRERFIAWAAYLGIFAKPSLCLDRRLQHHPDLQDLVLRLLDVLRINITEVIADHEESQDRTVTTWKTDSQGYGAVEPLLEIIKAIEGALDRLNRLGIAIRQSSVTSRETRVKKFIEASSDYTVFKELAYIAVRTLYPEARDSLQDQLSTSMAERYAKVVSRRLQQQKLESRRPRPRPSLHAIFEDVEMEEPVASDPHNVSWDPVDRMQGLTPFLETKSIFSSEPPSSADTQFVQARMMKTSTRSGSRRSRASSIQINRMNYPRPEQVIKNSKYLTCEWCFESHHKKFFEGDNWKRHVDKDLEPYVCLAESCAETIPGYSSFQEWQGHMLTEHGRSWHREVHWPSSWVCPLCPGMSAVFQDPQDMYSHMRSSHGMNLTDSELQTIVGESRIQVRRQHEECLICCLRIEEEPSRGASSRISGEAILKDRVDVGKRQKEPIASSHPTKRARTGSDGKPMPTSSEPTGEDPQDPTTVKPKPISMEAISRHIAAHLQALTFLTTRLMVVYDYSDIETGSQSSFADTSISLSSNGHRQNEEEARGTSAMSIVTSEEEGHGITTDEVDTMYGLPPPHVMDSGPAVDWDAIHPIKDLNNIEEDRILRHMMEVKQTLDGKKASIPSPLLWPPSATPIPQRSPSRVSFSNIWYGVEATKKNPVSYVLKHDHQRFSYSKRSRILLLVLETATSEYLLQWYMTSFASDGDEVVCLSYDTQWEKLPTITDERKGEKEARVVMDLAQSINTEGRAIRTVVEYVPAITPFADVYNFIIDIYQPGQVIVGIPERNMGSLQNLLLRTTKRDTSKFLLQYSPVPVIVVRPPQKIEKSKTKRIADPTRQLYKNSILASQQGVHESDLPSDELSRRYPIMETLEREGEEEAGLVARALGLPATFDRTHKPHTGESYRFLKLPDDSEGDDNDEEDEYEIGAVPGKQLLESWDLDLQEQQVNQDKLRRAMELGEATALGSQSLWQGQEEEEEEVKEKVDSEELREG